MKIPFRVLLLCCVLPATASPAPTKRPHITAIASVTVWSSSLFSAQPFYDDLFPKKRIDGPCDWCERFSTSLVYRINAEQALTLAARPSDDSPSFLGTVGFATDNLKQMAKYLDEHKIKYKSYVPGKIESLRLVGPDLLIVADPEGHRISFVEQKAFQTPAASTPEGRRIIHAGFIVKDREAMDRFYKDVLGFRLYWHGGMKDENTDWVDMQLPDGTDWIEYMLNVPANADQHLRGVMNHIAIGVPNVHEAAAQLKENGFPLPVDDPAKIGRDGKWQLNLYDPDETRIELMEFTPVEKPCCSGYTGPHPKP